MSTPVTVTPAPARGGAAPTAAVLSDVVDMTNRILGAYGMADDVEMGMDTSFHEDLEMESIDLVTLAGMLAEKYGAAVNLAEFLAEKDLEEVISLTIGDVVSYVVTQID